MTDRPSPDEIVAVNVAFDGILPDERDNWQASCDVSSLGYETATSLTRPENAATPTPCESDRIADHTTFHTGGRARHWVRATTEAELIEAVTAADAQGEPLLVLSGGSNMLVSDDEFRGTVVQVATTGFHADVSGCGGAVVRLAAGEGWDDFVAYSVDQEWYGLEALSGIPGLVGTTPVQNVGAYGADVSQSIYRVRTFDRVTSQFVTFFPGDCGFGYRDSVFKRERLGNSPTGRYVVLEVWFQLNLGSLSAPIRYAELARTLGVQVGDRAPSIEVRDAVLAIRRAKGMVIDETDHDTWSAGSFFTNPILDATEAAALPSDAPRYPVGNGKVKISAAWLIDHAGYPRGYMLAPGSPASLSTKHVLALTNRGGATGEDLAALAVAVRDGVEARFGVRLIPEPVLVGLQL